MVGDGALNVQLPSESITRALRRKREEVRLSPLNETHHNPSAALVSSHTATSISLSGLARPETVEPNNIASLTPGTRASCPAMTAVSGIEVCMVISVKTHP